ncbi:methylenetetrahydrofolate reductase [candidate division WOR-3 bacterium]|nr:methylenetetrahydrofolate reductase [candidate division WOR-3 bacterium]
MQGGLCFPARGVVLQIPELIARRTRPLVSIEITPPEKGRSISELFGSVDQLLPYDPTFITVTYHQQRIVYEDVGAGLTRKIPRRKNPGTVGICAAIYNRYKIETVPHIICGGFDRYETEDALIDLQYLGFRNLFVLRGDPAPGQKEFVPEPNGHRFASELTAQIAAMNHGHYLEDLENAVPTDFCIGVAGYPEKHYEAPNLADDLRHLKEKVDAGADYIITQMVFAAQPFLDFADRARAIGIKVPIIPGIKPVTSARQLVTIPREFHVDLPEELVSLITHAAAPADAARAGVEFTTRLCRELLKRGVPGLHFYTMGRGRATAEVLKATFT